ncbi:MAG: hypothetical protein JWO78_1039 [Micavibrio sp.]|nr:hypothetical protein [Micavibrio sp.]
MIAVQPAIDGSNQHGVIDTLHRQGIEVADGAARLAHPRGRILRHKTDTDFTEYFEGIHFFCLWHCFHP